MNKTEAKTYGKYQFEIFPKATNNIRGRIFVKDVLEKNGIKTVSTLDIANIIERDVGTTEAEANAAYIVRAVNNYQKLCDTVENLIFHIQNNTSQIQISDCIHKAREVLREAERGG